MELTTRYMGLVLRNPLVASASPLAHSLDGVRRLAGGGVGAVVLHSLFEEELEGQAAREERLFEAGSECFAESLSYFPGSVSDELGPGHYLSLVERASAAVEIPVIASLNGATPGGWTGFARSMQDAGAVAIELNTYFLPDVAETSGRDAEQRVLDIVGEVKAVVDVPVAVKLSPYFSSIGEMARRLDALGADALVLFNRFLQPDIDPEAIRIVAGLGLSSPFESRLSRTWIARLHGQLDASLAASTGVEHAADVAAYLLAGADVVMTTSSLLRHGPEHAAILLEGLSAWMERKGFATLEELRGRLATPPGALGAGSGRLGYTSAVRSANASPYGPFGESPFSS